MNAGKDYQESTSMNFYELYNTFLKCVTFSRAKIANESKNNNYNLNELKFNMNAVLVLPTALRRQSFSYYFL